MVKNAALARFVTTQWGLVLRAGTAQEPEAAAALGQLYNAYRQPLVGYVTRAGYSPEDAEDLVENFFEQLIRRGSLAVSTQTKERTLI